MNGGPRLALVVAGVLTVGAGLRTVVSATSPVLDRVSADLALGSTTVALLAAAPPLAFAASGVVGPALARRLSLERAMLAAALLCLAGNVGRVVAVDGMGLLSWTVLALLGSGIAGVLLPAVIKHRVPGRGAVVTAGYLTLMSLGSAAPPLLAAVAAPAIGWRGTFAAWAGLALLGAVPWLVLRALPGAQGAPAAAPASGEPSATTPRSMAWGLAMLFTVAIASGFTLFAYLPAILTESAGMIEADAALALAVFAIVGLPGSMIVPLLAGRKRLLPVLVAAGTLAFAAGLAGLWLLPAQAPFLWALLAGLGTLLFPLSMTLVGVLAGSPAEAVRLSGFAHLAGYLAGAVAPLMVGGLRESTGGWAVPLAVLLFVILVLGASATAIVVRRMPA